MEDSADFMVFSLYSIHSAISGIPRVRLSFDPGLFPYEREIRTDRIDFSSSQPARMMPDFLRLPSLMLGPGAVYLTLIGRDSPQGLKFEGFHTLTPVPSDPDMEDF